MTANQSYRKPLPGTDLEYYDARAACEDIKPGSYDKLPYTSRILSENLVNRADKVDLPMLQSWLGQLIEGKQEIDFPWYPARVVCHDILGQTALVDLADRAGGFGRLARCDCRKRRRSCQSESGGADAAYRRPLFGGGVRRLRS